MTKTLKLKLIHATITDLVFTLILCAMSFYSDFVKELITIFLLSFYTRFIFNYYFSKEEIHSSKQK